MVGDRPARYQLVLLHLVNFLGLQQYQDQSCTDHNFANKHLFYKVVCGFVCRFPHISVSFSCMGLKCGGRARGDLYVKTFYNSPGGGDLTKELKWMVNVHYLAWNNSGSYVQLLAMLYVVSIIVPSYVIYVKYPHKFIRMVQKNDSCIHHCHLHCSTKACLGSARSHMFLQWLSFLPC